MQQLLVKIWATNFILNYLIILVFAILFNCYVLVIIGLYRGFFNTDATKKNDRAANDAIDFPAFLTFVFNKVCHVIIKRYTIQRVEFI